MSQAREDDNGFTHVKCAYCHKEFKFLNADPELVESVSFCSESCRNLHYWYKGKAKFETMFKGEFKEGKKPDV